MSANSYYYVPEKSHWPLVGTIGLVLTVYSAVLLLHGNSFGRYSFFAGACILAYMMYGWFSTVIREGRQGHYNDLMDRSYRMGMSWFIFSEVMFFAAFFGALFYARQIAVPWIGGADNNAMTQSLLWPQFEAIWPLLQNPDPEAFTGPGEAMGPTGLPLINTLILLTSGVTITLAHWALKKSQRLGLILWLAATVALGVVFLVFQVIEYQHAYSDLGLTLDSGIYGSTFFMLTGFHGAHVTIGAIMLTVILIRSIKGDFTAKQHFGFEAAAWYWHFVDVVWLGLFIFVYWI